MIWDKDSHATQTMLSLKEFVLTKLIVKTYYLKDKHLRMVIFLILQAKDA